MDEPRVTAMLAFCRCGHVLDDHARGPCRHVNRANARRDVDEHQCTCVRFIPDARLTDSEDFIGKVLEKVIAKESIPIEAVEREEALQVLRIALWKTSVKYDSRSHVRFRVYAYLELYNDAIDHFRSERGRHGQHRVFDARRAGEHAGDGDEPAFADRLDGAASLDPADDPDHWAADGGGLLAEGDGPPARPLRRQGGGNGGGDVAGDRRSGVPAARRAGAEGARPRGAAAQPVGVNGRT